MVMKRKLGRMRVLAALLVLVALPVFGAGIVELPSPGPRDTCPVCGMFVSKYPEWVATLAFKDGHIHHFDGAKDLFKFLQDVPRYDKRHEAGEIAAVLVTEYYGVTRIDARRAWFVTGSDVLGPMGHELVPLASEAEAKEFLADHHGRAILRFDQVTREVIRTLDR
jgi:nitrous oxide reductase accessory protein NosL